MNSKSVYKVPNGKLLKISLIYDKKNKTIDKIRIMGDFFAYPEESIESMEEKLVSTHLDEKSLMYKINAVIQNEDIEFIGLDVKGLTIGILMCVK